MKVSITQIKFEPLLYPRTIYKTQKVEDGQPDWVTTSRYARAMKAGAIFPPVVLWDHKKEKILIDGWHRVKASQSLGKTEIDAEFTECKNYDDALIQAFTRNHHHGKNYDTFEIINFIARLEQRKIPVSEIANIIEWTVKDVKKAEQRIQWKKGKSDGFFVIKRPALKTFTRSTTEDDQRPFRTANQVQILNQMIALLEGDLLDINDKEVQKKMQRLKELMNRYMG